LARELWCALPKEIQSALIPEDNKAKFTIISGDPFWNAFPWELLRFADGEDDYLGLHQTLPRIGALQAKDLDVQLSLKQLGSGAGTIAILAPHDTGRVPLEKVIDEVEAVKQAINERGGNVVGYALGSDANDVSIKKQLELRPDIVYYSGHGKVIQNEEVLVLHDARFELCKRSYFGKENLEDIAQLSGSDVFLQRPLIVLNSCHTGRSRTFGGAREDFVSALLLQGAGAVISTALPIYEDVGKALGEALFAPNLPENSDIATIVLQARQSLARDLCENIKTPFWGAWGMIHLHGNALAKLSFNHYKV
jgi:CHAT domain-containing protein